MQLRQHAHAHLELARPTNTHPEYALVDVLGECINTLHVEVDAFREGSQLLCLEKVALSSLASAWIASSSGRGALAAVGLRVLRDFGWNSRACVIVRSC